jgi:ABC-type multidrug transport system ATPase subunit
LDPEILFLDEPTAGLDPIGAAAFDNLIATLRNALELTVFLVTHDLDTLYTICDRVAVLSQKSVSRGFTGRGGSDSGSLDSGIFPRPTRASSTADPDDVTREAVKDGNSRSPCSHWIIHSHYFHCGAVV